jgi:photosystem II stability/assembly factor-like uncharacterized protein
MRGPILISTMGRGLARAACAGGGVTAVETLLEDTAVTCLAADPLQAGRVYAGTQGRGVLRSEDGGRSWQPRGTLGPEGGTVKAIAASSQQKDVLYAGTKPARLFKSEDGGASWHELAAFRRIRGRRLWFSPAERPFSAYVQAIALSPCDAERIVVGIEFGATVVSGDGGRSWSNHRRGALRDCHNLCFHAVDGNWVYEAGGTGGGAAFSRDGGLTWTQARQGLDRHYGWAVTADPGDPATWYVSLAPGPARAHGGHDAGACIFRHDGGGWRRLGGPPPAMAHMPYALVTRAGEPGALYTGLSNGEIWYSADRGDTWVRLPVRLPPIRHTLLIL